ncbi:hypothetical protein Bca101_072573 [Brassica carinata]
MRPPTNAAVDAMLSVTTPSTARKSHPAEQTQDSALHTQTTDRPMEPPILLPEERNIPDTDLATILRSLVEKVDDLTHARARTDDHDSDIAQEQEEEQANQRHTRRIPAELAAQIQRNLFRDSKTPAQRQTAGVGRKFDGESGNIGIKGDASGHTPGACAASVAILGLSSGRTLWFHKSCGGVYGSVPRNSERENLGEAKDQEDEESVMDFREGGTFSMFVLVPGDNLVDSWYRSRSLGLILYGEQNPKAGWTVVKESVGCVDLQGDLLVYPFDSKSYPLGRLKDGTICVRLVNPEYKDASHSTFRR